MSTGSDATVRTAAISMPVGLTARADRIAQRGRGEAVAGGAEFDNHDDLLGAARSHPHCGRPAHCRDRLGESFQPHRRNRTIGGHDDVYQPALDPQPALIVEVPDIAGPVPPTIAARRPFGDPKPVVALFRVGGARTPRR